MNSREKAYEIIKMRARQKKEERLSILETLRQEEEFDFLYRAINSKKWDIARAKDNETKVKCEEELKNIQEKFKKYIAQKGYTEDILSDTENCKLCHDTGVCDGHVCMCAEEVRKQIEIKDSPLLRDVCSSFSDVDFSFYGREEEQYKKYASYLQNQMINGELNYAVLSGKTGTAKTFISAVCVKNMMEQGESVFAINALQMNKIFLEYHCAFLENKNEIWQGLLYPDVLLIDDLGVEQILNNVTVNYLYALLVERIDKKTIFTTNLDVFELEERYGQRIVSRLLDKRRGAILPIVGRDFRFGKKE